MAICGRARMRWLRTRPPRSSASCWKWLAGSSPTSRPSAPTCKAIWTRFFDDLRRIYTMGITIAYRGRLVDLARIEDFEDRLLDLALEVGGLAQIRSEERRVGKECRCGW